MFKLIITLLFFINLSIAQINDLEKVSLKNTYVVDLTHEEIKFLKDKKHLTAHNEKYWPPFNFEDEGKARGFSVDYMNLLGKKLGIKIKYISGYTWSEYMDLLQTDKLDTIINISKNKERSKSISFTDSFYSTQNAILVNNNDKKYFKLIDLYGKKIAMPKDFFATKYIEKKHPQIKIIYTKDSLEALKKLSLGQVQATIGKKVVLDFLVKNNNISGLVAAAFIEDKDTISNIRIGVSKKDEILSKILNKAQKYVTHKELSFLKEKWFGLNSIKKHTIKLTKKEKDYLNEKESLNICVRKNWLPYSDIQNEQFIGIAGDYLNIISKKLDIPLKIIEITNNKEAIKMLKIDTCDIKVITIDGKEIKSITATTPYIEDYISLVTKIDTPFISNLNSVKENKFVVIDTHKRLISKIKKTYPTIKFITVDSVEEALEMVLKDKAFGFIDKSLSSIYTIQKKYSSSLKVINHFDKIGISFGVSTNNIVLFNLLEKTIKSISVKDKINIRNNWTMITITEKLNYNSFFYFIGFVLLISLALVYRQKVLGDLNKKLEDTVDIKTKELLELNNSLEEKVIEKTKEQKILLSLFDKGEVCLFKIKNAKSHKIDYVSENAHTIFGYTSKELMDKSSFSYLIHPDDIEQVEKETLNKINNGNDFWVLKPYRIIMKNNITKWVLDNRLLLRDSDNKVYGFLGYLSDIDDLISYETHLKKLVEEKTQENLKQLELLQQQSRLAQMGEMISMIAHQWRQPLSGISSVIVGTQLDIQTEVYDFNKPKEIKKFIKTLDKKLEKMTNYISFLSTTIDDFRNFFKPNQEKEILSINVPIKKSLDISKPNLIEHNIKIINEVDDKILVNIHRNEMVQVFLNAFKNSIDNFKEKNISNRIIKIKTKTVNDKIKIIICDNGGGVPVDILPKVFEPYFSTKDEKNGTGLGLYMSKTMVEEHNKGKLELYNFEDGLCFEITLDKVKQ